MFGSLAVRYDSFNHWASLGLDYGWRRAAIRALRLSVESSVLDLATGTGDLAFSAARRARISVGLDFAREMVDVAKRKTRARASGTADPGGVIAATERKGAEGPAFPRVGRVAFQVGSAEALPYKCDIFDGATSAFAMRNVKPMLDEVLAEVFRVLRPGGRVAILEFSRPRVAPVRWAHRLYTRHIMPRIGRRLTGTSTPFEYLYRSIEEWQSPNEFAATLERAGFEEVGYRRMALGTVALHTGRKPACRAGIEPPTRRG